MIKNIEEQEYLEKVTIVIIEDNQGDFVLIEDYLLEKFKQIEIVHFTDFETAKTYLQEAHEQVSLLLLDLHLPDLKGIELINKMVALNFHIPIIILSGYSDLDLAKRSLQIGVYDYLIKDEINPVVLHKTIIYALNRSNYIHQIEDEKRNYENLFNFNPQPTWLLDANSLTILHANIAAQKKYGYTLEEFLKMSFTQLHPSEEKETIKCKLISKENEITESHFTHILQNGNEIKVAINFREINTMLTNEIIVQSNDISQTLKHINTIEIQNAKLRDIAWTQSHLVRAPLARILGIINLIEMDNVYDEELLFYLKQLRVSSNEMDELIQKIVNKTNHIEKE